VRRYYIVILVSFPYAKPGGEFARSVIAFPRGDAGEERLTALVILVQRYGRADERERQCVFDLYMQNTSYVNGWDLVDVSTPHIVGAHLLNCGGTERRVLERLVLSPSLWERRIAIMAPLALVWAGDYDETLQLARVLLDDGHDLIHKAVGWMLREVGKRDQALLVDFLERHGSDMPRTMLRYAIERLDAPLRAKLMATERRRRATVAIRVPNRAAGSHHR
jgi:3-methyladenine DNA glycosylase AlkD